MIIHVWMHWFWITSFLCKGLFLILSRNVICSSSLVAEAGLLDNSEEYVLFKDKLFRFRKNASHDVDDIRMRLRRDVGEESAPLETTTVVENKTGEASYRMSDIEDTYNGGSMDVFQYPLKKYVKYSKYSTTKGKPKMAEESEEKSEEVETTVNPPGNETASGETESFDSEITTMSVMNDTETGNETESVKPDENGQSENATKDEPDWGSGTEVPIANETSSVSVLQPETNLTAESKLDESAVHTTIEPFFLNNRVAAATSSESRERLSQDSLDAGSITGITLGIVVISGVIGAISFVLYRRRYLNKPQALNDKSSNLDSSGYIDDTSLRENSEEMYSLDNDSFLNSLEAMTIQNYWTENVKHTKL